MISARSWYAVDGEIRPLCTRDDLIRLVVGMQWREWFALFVIDGRTTSFRCPTDMADLRPASTIVDEWLGVR